MYQELSPKNIEKSMRAIARGRTPEVAASTVMWYLLHFKIVPSKMSTAADVDSPETSRRRRKKDDFVRFAETLLSLPDLRTQL